MATWLVEGTRSCLVCVPSEPAAMVHLEPICDLLFVEGLKSSTLIEIMVIFVTIRTDSFCLHFEDS